MRVLVSGWFSFDGMGATAGDLLARDLVCQWLRQAGIPLDIANASPFCGGVDWKAASPQQYTDVVFVCGPFGNGWPVDEFLERYASCRLHGLNLSMLQELSEWNPFDFLMERDSSSEVRPDLVFLTDQQLVPVVGVVLIQQQKEYSSGALHEKANGALEKLLESREVSRVSIDTRLDLNATGLRTSAEVESLIAKTDVVVTTRLHGLVLAIKHDIPVLAIDPIAGGAKVHRQAKVIGWPIIITADQITDERLNGAFDYCQGDEAKERAVACHKTAVERMSSAAGIFLESLQGGSSLSG